MYTSASATIAARAAAELAALQMQLNEHTNDYLLSQSKLFLIRLRLENIGTLQDDSHLVVREREALLAGQEHYMEEMNLDLKLIRGVHARIEEVNAEEKARVLGARGKMGRVNMERAKEIGKKAASDQMAKEKGLEDRGLGPVALVG